MINLCVCDKGDKSVGARACGSTHVNEQVHHIQHTFPLPQTLLGRYLRVVAAEPGVNTDSGGQGMSLVWP